MTVSELVSPSLSIWLAVDHSICFCLIQRWRLFWLVFLLPGYQLKIQSLLALLLNLAATVSTKHLHPPCRSGPQLLAKHNEGCARLWLCPEECYFVNSILLYQTRFERHDLTRVNLESGFLRLQQSLQVKTATGQP